LNEVIVEDNWEVDINDPSKVLTVIADSPDQEVKEAVSKAGYKAEKL
jgi:hypothetical protein